jgi:hypothetical protein
MGTMSDDDTKIPMGVVLKLYAYRDARREARATFLACAEASRVGDREKALSLEKQRDAKSLAIGRARVDLDEAIGAWTP